MSHTKFSPSITKELGYYVYLYTDPRDGQTFYVGKGKGNRAFAHLDEDSEHEKVKIIHEIREAGLEPQIEVLVHGLEEEASLRVEAAVIDLLGKDKLTNKVGGYRSSSHGRMTLEQLRAIYEKEEVTVTDPAILIRISKLFRHNMSPAELYDATRHAWPVGDRANQIKYALAVYDGIVREVYEVSTWLEAGSTFLNKKPSGGRGVEKRKEFVGRVAAEEIRKKYLYKSVSNYFKKGQQFPFTYVGLAE
ncbi:LEM-3-like GIY-YIG domain-containing protein [Rubritalea tangerina]|uniref:GIY-YIG domain-containing protein n=1 Tax=Rubritalea tangerina TaxID=430798 RepID=A0ABW4ZDG9_9BACT